MAADRATVDRLLEDLQKLNKEAREGGYSDVMLVDVVLGSPRFAPQIAVLEREEEEEDAHLEPEHKPVPLTHPDAPPKGVKAAKKRKAEGSGKEIILQVLLHDTSCVRWVGGLHNSRLYRVREKQIERVGYDVGCLQAVLLLQHQFHCRHNYSFFCKLHPMLWVFDACTLDVGMLTVIADCHRRRCTWQRLIIANMLQQSCWGPIGRRCWGAAPRSCSVMAVPSYPRLCPRL
jgi:hypothetical protein